MPRKATLITNGIIGVVLVALSLFVFGLDLGNTYLGITAPLYNGKRDGNRIAIMFVLSDKDTGANLPTIVNALKAGNCSATFFVSGMFIANNLELVKSLAADFEVGNYGFSNIRLDITDRNKIRSEIVFCNDIIKSLTGKSTKLFTPPDMLYNRNTLAVAGDLGYKTILPSSRPVTINWATADTHLVNSYATHQVKSGDIILLRPTVATMQTLSRILTYFVGRDFSVVSVSSLLQG